jgi:hypothetical protein
VSNASVDQAGGLDPAHELHESPRLFGRVEAAVKPDQADRAVVGQQFPELGLDLRSTRLNQATQRSLCNRCGRGRPRSATSPRGPRTFPDCRIDGRLPNASLSS